MRNIIVDTSVVVKWFTEEVDSQKAKEILFLKTQGQINLIFPLEMLLEIINVVFFSKKLTKEDGVKVIEEFLNLEPKFISIDERICGKIIDLVYKYKIASYDAFFIALADVTNCLLITADYKHHQKNLSSHIIWLSEWSGKF